MRQYKLDDKSFERYRGASKEQVNKLLTNVYAEGYREGQEDAKKKPGLYLTEEEFKNMLVRARGIGDSKYAELYKAFIDINNNRGRN